MNFIDYGVIASAIIISFTSCHSHSDEPQVTGPQEVSFVLGGEFTQISYEPLSRAETSVKYIGMNVYARENSYEEYKPYAYGVFTSVDSMKIWLSPSQEYKFECTTLSDDKDKIAKIKNGDEAELHYPFYVGPSNSNNNFHGYKLSDLDKFISSDTENLSQIKYGTTTVAESVDADGFALKTKDPMFPSQMRYYGIENDYKVSNGVATISLKSVSFGLKIEIDAENLDGELTLAEKYGSSIDLSALSLSDSQTECVAKYSYTDLMDWWNPDDTGAKTTSFEINFTWRHGNYLKTANKIIDVYRNKLTVISINLANIDKQITFNILEEEGLTEDPEHNFSVSF